MPQEDISPGAEAGQYNGCAPFNGNFYPSISTTAHLLNGKTIANNHHIPNNSNVDIYLISDLNLRKLLASSFSVCSLQLTNNWLLVMGFNRQKSRFLSINVHFLN